MKTIASFLFLFALIGLALGQLYYSNNVTRAEAIKAASQLKIGMWEEEASKNLATSGIKDSMSVGAIGGWDRFYGLSDGSSLHLSYTARSIATNGWWGGNGLLQKAFIQSNGVDIVSIPLAKLP